MRRLTLQRKDVTHVSGTKRIERLGAQLAKALAKRDLTHLPR
jgi:hypothetical protein